MRDNALPDDLETHFRGCRLVGLEVNRNLYGVREHECIR